MASGTPSMLSLNCNSSRLGVTDSNGIFRIIDLHFAGLNNNTNEVWIWISYRNACSYIYMHAYRDIHLYRHACICIIHGVVIHRA